MASPNQAQIEQWNGRVGAKWAALHEATDAMFAPAAAALLSKAGPVAGLRVLDIGCGSGDLSARLLAKGASVTGLDVSAAMLAVAKTRTQGKIELIQADAAAWKSAVPFDLAVSQFGLMFFHDPSAAFAAIGDNLRPGARLVFTCWRAFAQNAWAAAPMAAIRDLLPAAAPSDPYAPGPFAFAERAHVEKILAAAGFADIALEPFDFDVCMAATGGAAAAVELALQIGPAASALAGADKTEAAKRLHVALAPYEKDGAVALGGAIWIVEARSTA